MLPPYSKSSSSAYVLHATLTVLLVLIETSCTYAFTRLPVTDCSMGKVNLTMPLSELHSMYHVVAQNITA